MKIHILIALLWLFCGCAKSRAHLNSELQSLNEFVVEMDIDISDYRSILFIPLEGCGSCIKNAVDFYEKSYYDNNILYIFCTYKPHTYKFLKENEKSNVIIDRNDIAIKHRILSTAPVAYKRNNNLELECLGIASDGFDLNILF